jgi:hypothetical protein
MLGLKLRDEFSGINMPGTAIELATSDKNGAAQREADYILSITYPTTDVYKALQAISSPQTGRPIVLRGVKGRGKSHIMALMHHAIASPDAVEAWLKSWASRGKNELASISLLRDYLPISEAVHNFEYSFLWDLIFKRHPRGEYYRGQFESANTPVPSRSLLERMFQDKKTCLILDEFQTWYNSLPETDNRGVRVRDNAFAFIQLLSEIAYDHPEILILVVSVRDSNNEAYTQIRRQNPIDIDFLGVEAKQERQKLLLHRLFENRDNIPNDHIQTACAVYANERVRLLFSNESPQEKTKKQTEVYSCWPFSPELLDLLENQILLSLVAQETRDLIKILAQVYKSRGDQSPVITPADFFVDSRNDEVQTLITSIAANPNPDKLRRIAQDNLASITVTAPAVTYARELISDIWMHSLFHDDKSGINTGLLHLEITRGSPIDDNTFQVELAALIENSTHLLGGESAVSPIKFSLEENPGSKVRTFARNDNLWDPNAVPTGGNQVYPGLDIQHIRDSLKKLLFPEDSNPPSKIIVLGSNWRDDPWSEVKEEDQPDRWDRPVLIVIPEYIENESLNAVLGKWLTVNLTRRRNTVRFLLPGSSLFTDRNLILVARFAYLCSKAAWGVERTYNALWHDFKVSLDNELKSKYGRFAILQNWDFQNPSHCVFEVSRLSAQSSEIPTAIEETVLNNYFDFEEFKRQIIEDAKNSNLVRDVIEDYIEPPPTPAITVTPYLADGKLCELILKIVASGDIVINENGTWWTRKSEDIDDATAYKRIRTVYKTIDEMKRFQLALPGAAVSSPPIAPSPSPAAPSNPPPAPGGGSFGGVLSGSGPAQSVSPMPCGVSPSSQGSYPPIYSLPKIKSSGPASGINIIGQLEQWNLAPDQEMTKMTLEFSNLTTAQIRQLLQRIPSGIELTISVTYNEDSGSSNGGAL